MTSWDPESARRLFNSTQSRGTVLNPYFEAERVELGAPSHLSLTTGTNRVADVDDDRDAVLSAASSPYRRESKASISLIALFHGPVPTPLRVTILESFAGDHAVV
jgi:hypothetical protein